jgi:hypothetical protein
MTAGGVDLIVDGFDLAGLLSPLTNAYLLNPDGRDHVPGRS